MTAPIDQTQGQEIDGSDEEDHDSQEQALGIALAALLLAELLPGPATFLSGRNSWRDRVEGTLGQTLRGFIERTAFDLAQTAGAQNASAASTQAVQQVYPQILAWVEDRSHETLQNLTDAGLSDADLAERTQSAAQNLARGVAVYAKNETRQVTGTKLGAIWKVWRTRHDDRVRSTHRELEGQQVSQHGMFYVESSGSYLRFPGDPEAPIEETAGCRCRLNYKLRPGLGKDNYGEVL